MSTPSTDDVLRALATLGDTPVAQLKGELRRLGFIEPGISAAIQAAREAGLIKMDWRGHVGRA